MNSKTTIMLVLAILCGLGAMYGTSQLLSKEHKETPVIMEDLVVAARNLKVDELVKPELVKTIKVAKDAIPPGSLSKVKDAVDRFVQLPILADEPVLDAKLAPRGTVAGLVARIPNGMRAFAIEVNETTGVSGFVLPGHRVDVVQSLPAAGSSQPQAEIILQNVLVLATGQIFNRPEDKSILARTVTLAVTPDQVETLVASRARGPLALSLRGVNDNQTVARKPPPPAPLPPPPPPPDPEPPKQVARKSADPEGEEPVRPKYKRIVIIHGPQGVEVVQIPIVNRVARDAENADP
jgi:pilus assembly protein CpaB